MQPVEFGNQFISYKYLSATKPNQLEKKMLEIQITNSKSINFTPPTYNERLKTYETWYLYNYADDIDPRAKLKMGNK